jgi:tRNA1(Val) A37 N6-methylase TrmN6
MTVDDVCVGAIASALDFKIETYLDLGTGLGSVLNIVNWKRHGEIKRAFAFEAQEKNYRLANKTVQYNGINQIVDIMNFDMRTLCDGNLFDKENTDVYERVGKVDLITGTPPYFPLENKTLPDEVGRGMCAFEIRGGVEVYCEIAAKFIKKKGRFVMANGYLQLERTLKSAHKFGFVCSERYDIHGKEDKEPLFTVFCFEYLGLDLEFTKSEELDPTLHNAEYGFDNDAKLNIKRINIRGLDCQFTKEYEELMYSIGKPPVTFEIETIPHAQRDQFK